ncbi:telomerase RNA component interacting RNase-like [Liolophura sinensis]|uniref:telomerase RNA component interacting RNase-like n=1 Tax=Liolophura sinensis TaxID=3198878 RepID=UPI003158D890
MSHSWNTPSQGQQGGFNKFANDGSFMDMFRRKMEEEKEKNSGSQSTNTKMTMPSSSSTSAQLNSKEEPKSTTNNGTLPASEKPSILSFVGKRRGGKVLKTGAVKKVRKEEEKTSESKDAWALYLDEVKKYKSQMCVDEDKTRPLVK